MHVLLIHWKRAEIAERARRIARAGHSVEARHEVAGPAFLRDAAAQEPSAIVIDLSRLPSHGREVGVALRTQKATRHIPLVFVGGMPEKVGRVRAVLPDAEYVSWRGIRGGLTRARRRKVAPVVPASRLASYAGTPLPRKLGIKPGMVVALVDPPENVERMLGPLPEGVTLRHGARGKADLTLLFVRRARTLQRRLPRMLERAAHGGLWIVWPKKTSPLAADLGQPAVRAAGLAAGLVDFKICRMDETWAALRFTQR